MSTCYNCGRNECDCAAKTQRAVLEQYEMVAQGDFSGWICRRCTTVHLDASLGDDGKPTWKGITLADPVESATEHEQEKHP